MSYETTEYVARDDGGNVTSRVNVHSVTDESDGDFVQTTGGARQVHTGDKLVQAGNPNFWDVFPGDEFDKLGYESPDSGGGVSEPADPVVAPDAGTVDTGGA